MTSPTKNKKIQVKQNGQAILVILLVISVILVIGLSIASRSVTDIKISQQSQESARALWVAQAGLEQAIRANAGISETALNDVDYNVIRRDIGGTPDFAFPLDYPANESAVLWLVNRDTEGNITSIPGVDTRPQTIQVLWGSSQDCALEATLVYQSGGSYYAKRFVYDAPGSSREPPTNFITADNSGCQADGVDFRLCSPTGQSVVVPTGSVPYFLRLRLIFNTTNQTVGVKVLDGGEDRIFPIQGGCYVATAQVQESEVSRRLEECRLWPVTPPIFDFMLYSGGNID